MFNENCVQTDMLDSRATRKAANHSRLSRMLSKLSNPRQKHTGGTIKDPKKTKDVGDGCGGLGKDLNLLSNWARFMRSIRIKRLAAIKCQVVSETFRYTFRISLAFTLRALSIKGVSDDIVHRTQSSLYQTADRITPPYIVQEDHGVWPPPPTTQAHGGADPKRSICSKKPKSPLFASKSKKKIKNPLFVKKSVNRNKIGSEAIAAVMATDVPCKMNAANSSAADHGYVWEFEKNGAGWHAFADENSIAIESTWRSGVWAGTLQGEELTPGKIHKMVVELDGENMFAYAWGVAAPVSNIRRVPPATTM